MCERSALRVWTLLDICAREATHHVLRTKKSGKGVERPDRHTHLVSIVNQVLQRA
jgi:hypothetical protein